MEQKYECPCCGFKTLDKKPPGTFNICPVCYWEDDTIQFIDKDFKGGANEMSLNQARKNYMKYGAVSEKFKEFVRAPYDNEKP